jgi:hypothetical protein
MEARGSAGSTAPRIGGAWDRGSALQTLRTPETAPPKLVVFEVIALVRVWITATLSKGKDRSCKQAFAQKIGAVAQSRWLNAHKSVASTAKPSGGSKLHSTLEINAMCKRVQLVG